MVDWSNDSSPSSTEISDEMEQQLDLEALHHEIVERIGVSDVWRDELVPPSNWAGEDWDKRFFATLYVLGKILYRLDREKYRLEARIAWDQNWITGLDRAGAPMNYHSPTALADKVEESIREITAEFADHEKWRLVTRDLEQARRLKDDLVADLYATYPPAKDTKKARIQSLVDAGFGLWAEKRALAGLTETSKDYVNSIRNNRGGEAEPREMEKTEVHIRDNGRCVRCGCIPDQDQFHHIIPPREGGSGDPDNIALLCMGCHLAAHGGHFASPPIYDTKDEFWEWTNDNN